MTGPMRIRLSRAKGWRMPPNTVKVDRSTPLGNPFRTGVHDTAPHCVHLFKLALAGHFAIVEGVSFDELRRLRLYVDQNLKRLRGKNIGCWCRLCTRHKRGRPVRSRCKKCAPCHGDWILHIANTPPPWKIKPPAPCTAGGAP
jgi:hypothetical protein